MKERPILFSAPMIRPILAGTKTQTRRIVKPQPPEDCAPIIVEEFNPTVIDRHGDEQPGAPIFGAYDLAGEWGVRCPYGKPGDRLWVREKWSADPPIDDSWASTEWNGCGRKVREIPERFHHPRFCNYAADWLHEPIRWTPSIHMHRWASRILLEITAVRVERLQDISNEDIANEGAIARLQDHHQGYNYISAFTDRAYKDLRTLWEHGWESINGAGSWAANPWVWVVEFRRLP